MISIQKNFLIKQAIEIWYTELTNYSALTSDAYLIFRTFPIWVTQSISTQFKACIKQANCLPLWNWNIPFTMSILNVSQWPLGSKQCSTSLTQKLFATKQNR